MAIHSGTLSIREIEKIYNVGYAYARNIVDKLEEIGYIKKKDLFEYSMIQTEQAIRAYIKEHLKEFRPSYYDVLELKDDGKPTLKRKVREALKVSPVFMCRVFLSPVSVAFLFFALRSGIQTKQPIGDILRVSITTFFVLGGLCNIVYGLFASKKRDITFKEFMLRPWLHVRVQTILEIRQIMRQSKIKFKVSNYYETLHRLKIQLSAKKQLAEHYADIANNAENENEFYQSINSCLEVLGWMSQFEKYGVFSNQKPSDDIKTIRDGMDISIRRFSDRMNTKQKLEAFDYDNMEGHEFEYFCADLLRKNGYSNVEVTKGSGDQGIDIIAYKDGIKYGIQCKCYTQDIGNKAVQEAFSGKDYYDCHVAAVLTNRYFTQSARELSAKNGVLLWDRGKLGKMVENGE